MCETRKKLKEKYESSVEGYVVTFKNTYFKNIDCEDYWIGGEIGGVLFINDFFFGFDNIKYAIDNRITEKELFNWYDKVLEIGMNESENEPPTLQQWWENSADYKKRMRWAS